jgi:phosphate:Na+ symporter
MEVSATYFLLLMIGAAALLLWGTRLVRTGVQRAFGAEIRHLVTAGLKSRAMAAGSGALAAASLQSSTAVALLVASFARTGILAVSVCLALMLGADVGSALVASVLTLDVKRFWPVLIFLGYLLYALNDNRSSRKKEGGRVAFGIGLILLGLQTMTGISAELAASEVIRSVVVALSGEPLVAVLLLALLTWLAHSSIAILLFVASLAGAGLVAEPLLVVAMVLGINIGGAMPAIMLTLGEPAAARRVTIGNGMFKLAGAAVGLLLLPWLAQLHLLLPGEADFRTVLLHILFNSTLLATFIWFVGPIERLLSRFVVASRDEAERFGPLYVASTPAAVRPSLALSSLVRETLRMVDIVDTMLRQAFEMLQENDRSRAIEINKLDDQLDTLYEAIKSYATDLTRQDLEEAESRRAIDILSYSTGLENAGDIIDKSLIDIIAKKIRSNTTFSDEGSYEIARLYAYTIETNRLAAAVTMNWNVEDAMQLLKRKRDFKRLVSQSSEQHLKRLRKGEVRSLETSSYHLDIIGDIQRVNSLLAGIAYAVIGASEERKALASSGKG